MTNSSVEWVVCDGGVVAVVADDVLRLVLDDIAARADDKGCEAITAGIVLTVCVFTCVLFRVLIDQSDGDSF